MVIHFSLSHTHFGFFFIIIFYVLVGACEAVNIELYIQIMIPKNSSSSEAFPFWLFWVKFRASSAYYCSFSDVVNWKIAVTRASHWDTLSEVNKHQRSAAAETRL